MRPATDEEIAEFEAGLEGLPNGPWLYRPLDHDDWGTVRVAKDADGDEWAFVTNARSGRWKAESEDAKASHRSNGTDPYGPVARHIARCSPDFIRSLLMRIRADGEGQSR